MMAKPWAKATATIPLRTAPPPTTAAAPAPMKTNEKEPMNSARRFDVIRLDIVLSRDEIDCSARSGVRQGTVRWLGVADGTGEHRQPAKRADYSAAIVCGLMPSAFATPAPWAGRALVQLAICFS